MICQAKICTRSKVSSLDSCICIKTPVRNTKDVSTSSHFSLLLCHIHDTFHLLNCKNNPTQLEPESLCLCTDPVEVSIYEKVVRIDGRRGVLLIVNRSTMVNNNNQRCKLHFVWFLPFERLDMVEHTERPTPTYLALKVICTRKLPHHANSYL